MTRRKAMDKNKHRIHLKNIEAMKALAKVAGEDWMDAMNSGLPYHKKIRLPAYLQHSVDIKREIVDYRKELQPEPYANSISKEGDLSRIRFRSATKYGKKRPMSSVWCDPPSGKLPLVTFESEMKHPKKEGVFYCDRITVRVPLTWNKKIFERNLHKPFFIGEHDSATTLTISERKIARLNDLGTEVFDATFLTAHDASAIIRRKISQSEVGEVFEGVIMKNRDIVVGARSFALAEKLMTTKITEYIMSEMRD
jgi:hypothetical protein